MAKKKSSSKATKRSQKKPVAKVDGSRASAETQIVHGESLSHAWDFSHHVIPPMTASTSFRLGSLERGLQGFLSFASDPEEGPSNKPTFIYDRLDEPNTMMLEEQLAKLENAETSLSFSTGMGAISTAMMSVLKGGQKVIAHQTLYGCTYSLFNQWFPRLGFKTEMVDLIDTKSLKKAIDPDTRIIYFETVSNPNLEIIDVESVVKIAREENKKRPNREDQILVIVDNTFATPWGMRPLDLGVDMVAHSLTKSISGFGTEMGGAIMTRREFANPLKVARKDFGATMNPKAAWNILVHGIATLALRFQRQQQTALKVAKFLEAHPKVESVVYPGLKSHPQYKLAKKFLTDPDGQFAPGLMISFIVKGPMDKCRKFVDDIAQNSYSITLAVSLGLTKTLIEVPGAMTHSIVPEEQQQKFRMDPRAIRLSLGIEKAEDIIQDLQTALKKL